MIERVIYEKGVRRRRADREVQTHFEIMREICIRFIGITGVVSDPSPIDHVLRLRVYIKAIIKNTNVAGSI